MRHLLTVSIKGTPPEAETPESSDEWAGEALNFQNGNGCVGVGNMEVVENWRPKRSENLQGGPEQACYNVGADGCKCSREQL